MMWVRRILESVGCAFLLLAPLNAFQSSSGAEKTRQEKSVSSHRRAYSYDIRTDVNALNRTSARLVVETRRAEAAAFERQMAREQRPVRLKLNDWGLATSMSREGRALTAPSREPAEEIARSFLRAHRRVFPFTDHEIGSLRLVSASNADGLVFLRFQQTLDGVDVFEGQVRITLDGRGQVIHAGVDGAAPGLSARAAPRLTAGQAIGAAYQALGLEGPSSFRRAARVLDGWTLYENPGGEHLSAIAAAPCIFPVDAGSAAPAFRILLEIDNSQWYEIVVDAEDGRLLFLQNVYRQEAFGRVWRKSPLDGSRVAAPFPSGSYSAGSPESASHTLQDGRGIGLSSWLSSGGSATAGNNVDAYVDADGDGRPDTTTVSGLSAGRAFSAGQQFDFPTGDRTTLQDPRGFKPASVTSLFYFANLAHDYFYHLGFDEASGNLQEENFAAGGRGGDRVLAQAQDGSQDDNSAMAITPDGIGPRLRMGLYTYGVNAASAWNDAAYDGMVVMHEYAHAVTNRIIGGGQSTSCLVGIQSGALNEGWSDYFAISFFNDPVRSAYVGLSPHYGTRRASYERYPYAYEDLGNHGFEPHNDGEIWAGALWDVRNALGPAATDRLVVNGIRFMPCRPAMTDARDGILTADEKIDGGANRARLWAVFARHGLGFGAGGYDGDWRQGTVFTAAYDLPPDLQGGNRPPVVKTSRIPNPAFGKEFVYRISADDPDNGSLGYQLTGGPSGMTVDPQTGEVRWNTGFTSADARISLTDGQGGRVSHGFSLHVETPLAPGNRLDIHGAEDSEGFATVTVPDGTPVLQLTLRGAGDADLWLYDPTGRSGGASLRGGSTETLSIPAPRAGEWLIEIDAFRHYWSTTLSASTPLPRVLALPTTTLASLSGDFTSETFYQVTVPPGTASLKVTTSGGTGDVDVYVRRGVVPVCQQSDLVLQNCSFDASSMRTGNDDSVLLNNPAAGDYYINLYGSKSYSGVTLVVQGGGAQAAPRITSLTPSSGAPGQTIELSIAGSDLEGVTSTQFSPSAGITATVTRATSSEVKASVNIASTATAGARSVSVTAPSGTSNTLSFTIQSAPAPGGYDGQWSGTTNQGRTVGFTVSDNSITGYTFGVNFPYLGPNCPTGATITNHTPIPIAGNTFSGSFFSGTFTSSTAANGSLRWSVSLPGCSASGTLTWSASR